MKKPAGVAVNEASGDVYVVDEGANRVARFDKAGTYISEFNGSGTVEVGGVPIEGEAAGSGGREGEIPTGRFEEPEGIAVDNSCHLQGLTEATQPSCAEADPSNGDVYVVDAGFEHRVIDKYSPEGKYLGQISGAESRFAETLEGVAVDPEGAVWVYLEGKSIDGFTNAAKNTFTKVIQTTGVPGTGARPGFAVDSEGSFYVRHGRGEIPGAGISKVDHTGKVLIEELVSGEPSLAVAANQANDNSLISNVTSIGLFNEAGKELERLGAGLLSEGVGIGVNAAAGSFYVADAGSDTVLVFGPEPPKVPRVESESIAEVTSDSAELGGEVNPRSEAGEAPSEYSFQYGACATASTCAQSGYEASTPVPEGQIAPDFEVHALGAHLEGLKANTTYHFRLLVRNSHGEALPGEERVFTTQGAGGELMLPDGRGWELVSPPDKQGSLIEPISETGVVQAAAGGGGITYLANAPTEAEPQGYTNKVQVLSRRGAAAWSSKDIAIAHSGATGLAFGPGPEYKAFDAELNSSVVQPFGEFIAQLSGEASEQTAYLHELGPGCGSSCYRPLVSGKEGFANVPAGTVFGEEAECRHTLGHESIITCGPQFLGASEDLSHVVLRSKAALKEGAGEEQLYEWSGGVLSQVSVLPGAGGESAPAGAGLGLEEPPLSTGARGAVSADGERIAWSDAGELYLRDMARGETVQLDAAGCGECESGGGKFQFASSDGSRVFFTDSQKLTKDSGAEPTGSHIAADLYECKIALVEEELRCELSDLTPINGEEGAAVQGGILGASEDGSYVYFVAKGVQSEAQNGREQSALSGQANLYLRHGGVTSFITTLAEGDSHDWSGALSHQPTRAAGDGQWLELMSEARLSGYDNRDTATNKPVAEVYIYDAAANRLSCASCEPTGGRPVGVEYAKLEPSAGLVGGPSGTWPETSLVAANVPGWTAIGTGGQRKERYQPRYLENSGRLFFNSADALVPQDSNGTEDVYEYEPPGVGDCSEASPSFGAGSGGCVSLISSGGSAQESAFMDASESGDDVFFLTSARLSPLDGDAAQDIYDAHVCTTAQPCITFPTVQSPPCTTEASCKAAPSPQPSVFGAPASATFQGLGNPAPAATAVVKAKAKPPTRAQKLNKALKACHKDRPKAKRAQCQRLARNKFGPVKRAKRKGKR